MNDPAGVSVVAGDTRPPPPDSDNARGGPPRLAMPPNVMVWGAIVTSVIILIAYAATVMLLFFFELPQASQTQAASMFNTLQTLATLAAGFWLGSSAHSIQKTPAKGQP